MSNYGPASAWILVGGCDVTGDIFDLGESAEQVIEECHTFMGGDPDIANWEIYKPVGLAKVTLESGQGVYDTRTAGMLEAFQGTGASRQLVNYGFAGSAVGAPCVLIDGTYVAQFTRKAQRGNVTMAQAKHVINGARYVGRVISGFTARTGDSGDTKSTPLDQEDWATSYVITSSEADDDKVLTASAHDFVANDQVWIAGHTGMSPDFNGLQEVAAVADNTHFTMTGINITVDGSGGTVKRVSSRGCTLDLHVPAYTAGGASDVVITVAHSDDAAAWSTLTTFTAVTAAGSSERKTIAAGTLVKRYLAMTWNFTGGGGGSSLKAVVSVYRA